ncbi:hypothetical protein JCM8097_002450 [Rhodosporidiobolus ruineniae]
MPPRFWSSPFKNAVATPAKRESWYSELPLATSLPNETSDGIAATGEYWLALGSASGSLLAIPHSTPPGKFASRAPSLSTGLRTITSFAPDAFDDFVYVGGESGVVKVFDLPPAETFSTDSPAAHTPSALFSLSTGTNKPVDVLAPHPLASGIVLAASGSSLTIFDAAVEGKIVKQYELPSPAWSAQWSRDGRSVTATGKDGKLRVWDVRAGDGVVAETLAHAGLKPSRHVHLSPSSSSGGSFQILTTGTTKTRDREYSLFDLRNLAGGAIKTQRVDTNTGVLQPVLDEARGIVYLAGRGDMTLRWVEVGGPGVFTEGFAPLPAPLLSAALLPPRAQQAHLDLQHAEINRLLVLAPANDAVVPVEVKVPRRQYVDFFPELYPPVATGAPALSAADWLAGRDEGAILDKTQLEPGRAWPKKEKRTSTSAIAAPPAASPAAGAQPAVEEKKADLPPPVPVATETASTSESAPPPATTPAPASTAVETPPAKEEPPTASLSAPSVASQQTRPSFGGAKKAAATATPAPVSSTVASHPAPAIASQPSPAPPVAASTASSTPSSAPSVPTPKPFSIPAPQPAQPASKPNAAPPEPAATTASASTRSAGEPFNPGWSRKFLTGKTALKPDYFDVKDLSATTGADVVLLKASSLFLFYPLSGPGGRLAVHPLSQKGRLPTHLPALQNGATVVDFEVDPFNPRRVVVAGDDGAVRVFEVPEAEGEEGWAEKVGEVQGRVLSDSRMDRINALSFHPAAKDVLLSVSDDRGSPTARVWDVEKGEVIVEAALPKGGVSSVAWSPDGALLAVATKNKQLHILDPRNPSSVTSSPSHDSVRPVRVAWASDTHLVTTGLNRAASRELILYELDAASSKLSQIAKQSLDVSPAPLYPYIDLDTHILLAYSRGERSCLAYEISPAAKDKFTLLPKFEHGTLQSAFAFFNKTSVDVKQVEIIHALRLTPNEIQTINFTIPRAKVDRFQDDIYVPTRANEPSMSASEYKAGKNTPRKLVDLRPAGMELLSEAPIAQPKVSTRSQIKQDGMTDSQREQAYLDGLFQSAKAEGAEEDSEEEDVGRKKQAPADDDDW